MRVITQYEFDDEDRRLLSIKLPDNPCVKCSLNNTRCYGCPNSDKYAETVELYKKRNIYDLALKFKKMEELQNEIKAINKEINDIKKEIEATGLFD